jgi:uncharacterized protein (TIGR02271 family)
MKIEQLQRDFERLIDYEVQDQSGKKIGTVHSVWTDELGHRLFLSVKTNWIFGKHHVVPAHSATVNDKQGAIRVPYTEAKIKDAPSYDEGSNLTVAETSRIYSYYGVQEPRFAEKVAPKAAATTYAAAEKVAPAREAVMRDSEATMKLSEEELKIGKREVVAGGIRLHKIVRKETVSKPVELKREKFVIERVAATGKADHEFEDEDVFIPLRREEAVVAPVGARAASSAEAARRRRRRGWERLEEVWSFASGTSVPKPVK